MGNIIPTRPGTPLYVVAACYKYNYRETDMFWKFLKESIG